jgi:hypothetical protein
VNFYELVKKMFSLAKFIPLLKRLLCRDQILKHCRKVTARVNAYEIELWEYVMLCGNKASINCKQ